MSKWIILAGLVFLAVGTVFFFIYPMVPELEPWYWPLMQPGIVLTFVGTVLLVVRADW